VTRAVVPLALFAALLAAAVGPATAAQADAPAVAAPAAAPTAAPAANSTAAPAAIPPAAPAAIAPAAPAAASRQIVLERGRRLLRLLENGSELRRFPVAVGMPGWETPVGDFRVISKTVNPVWEHPEKGTRTPSGPANPLGSRWIGFYSDCQGRKGWDGEQMLDVRGCVVAGFHGTPHRWTVGHAVSHGCVRLYDEDVRELFDLVSLGTPVRVLP